MLCRAKIDEMSETGKNWNEKLKEKDKRKKERRGRRKRKRRWLIKWKWSNLGGGEDRKGTKRPYEKS